MDPRAHELLAVQSGVVSRAQLRAVGAADHDIRRMVRRNEVRVVHPGVYVNHTGPLTWPQRAWAAVLYAWPAALCAESALRANSGPGRRDRREDVIQVAVARNRSLVEPAGVRIHRMEHLDARALWNLSPPRLRVEEAALDVAMGTDNALNALGVLADAVQSRSTTAVRLRDALAGRAYANRRDWLSAVLNDIATGACSVLEHGYLTRVERPHRLPRGDRQVQATASARCIYRDVEYAGSLVVELDGRLFHDSASQRDLDFERDLDAAVDDRESVRISYGQVFDRACTTAYKIGLLLEKRGWSGSPVVCGPECQLRV